MNKHFISGFIKRASQYGLSEEQSIGLLKEAKKKEKKDDSSFIGRYLAMKALQGQALNRDMPSSYHSSMGSMIAGTPLPGHTALNIATLAAADPLNYAYSMPYNEKERKAILDAAEEDTLEESALEAGVRKAKNMILPYAVGGSALGGLTGFMLPTDGSEDNEFNTRLTRAALMAALGGVASGAGAGIYGLGTGAASKKILENTSEETKRRAKKMLAEHGIKTMLPLGTVAGAAVA